MKRRITVSVRRAMRRRSVLLLCLLVLEIIYWVAVFAIPSGNEFVAYQRF